MQPFQDTELILTADKRVYHLNVRDEDIADDVIVVGDQNRVAQISQHFDHIDFKTEHREFITHSGFLKGKRLTVLSTGIGTDNIDVVLNELDAAVNIDLEKRELKAKRRQLNIYRLGTSGALQEDLPVDALVASSHGMGLDGLLNFYEDWKNINENELSEAFRRHADWPANLPYPYCVAANEHLLDKFKGEAFIGITATAPGFYGPQGRQIRLKASMPGLNDLLTSFRAGNTRILNFEMETSALYGLGKLLDHRCLTICVIIANRVRKEFTGNYGKSVDKLIETCLNKIVS